MEPVISILHSGISEIREDVKDMQKDLSALKENIREMQKGMTILENRKPLINVPSSIKEWTALIMIVGALSSVPAGVLETFVHDSTDKPTTQYIEEDI